MDLKNLKNLSSPKYKISLISLFVVGGGFIFYGVKNFGPSSTSEESSKAGGEVKIDTKGFAARDIVTPDLEDYNKNENSEIARVYQQKRENERASALEGDGSYVFTITGSNEEDTAPSTKTSTPDPVADKPAKLELSSEQDDSKGKEGESEKKLSLTKNDNNKEGEPVDADAPKMSFQERLNSTKNVTEEIPSSPRQDPLRNQRQLYQASSSPNRATAAANVDFMREIYAKAEFSHKLNGETLVERGLSKITTYNPELPTQESTGEQLPRNESYVGNGEHQEANQYAEYIGVNGNYTSAIREKVNPGDIYYTRLQIGINTDEISPVRAEILSGNLSGAVLLGSPRLVGEKALIELTSMSFKGRTYPINAVALDLDTKRTAMADDVDNHLLRNMAYLGLSSVLAGYANSLQTWEETNADDNSGDTTKKMNKLDSFEDRVMVGLGEAGEEFKDVYRDRINRKPTVHVYPKDIAVMFMEELIIGGE